MNLKSLTQLPGDFPLTLGEVIRRPVKPPLGRRPDFRDDGTMYTGADGRMRFVPNMAALGPRVPMSDAQGIVEQKPAAETITIRVLDSSALCIHPSMDGQVIEVTRDGDFWKAPGNGLGGFWWFHNKSEGEKWERAAQQPADPPKAERAPLKVPEGAMWAVLGAPGQFYRWVDGSAECWTEEDPRWTRSACWDRDEFDNTAVFERLPDQGKPPLRVGDPVRLVGDSWRDEWRDREVIVTEIHAHVVIALAPEDPPTALPFRLYPGRNDWERVS